MIVVTLIRDKCIGCNYCVETTPEYFKMSKKDGKSVLLRASNKKGFHNLKINADEPFTSLSKAESVCPVKIIKVNKV